jgi:transketolase
MPQASENDRLRALAQKVREYILSQIYAGGSGHPGGSMSCVEILATIFGHKICPPPDWIQLNDRDHFILSKGHAAPALYAVFAAFGLIPEEELKTLRKLGSRLQGHPDRTRLEAVEMSTGSLGQGLSVAVGIAWALRKQHRHHSYVVLGDGEMNSGQVWEAIAFAGAHKLNRVIAILDANGIQNDGPVTEILDITPYGPKLEAFGWAVREVDGHSVEELTAALDWATNERLTEKPRFIVANTTKGSGVSFMAGRVDWHSHTLTEEQYETALKEVRSS